MIHLLLGGDIIDVDCKEVLAIFFCIFQVLGSIIWGQISSTDLRERSAVIYQM